MPKQVFAERQVPKPAVIFHPMAFDHLRGGLEIGVHAVERVEHHVAVVSADIGSGGHGIECHEILLRHEA